MYKEIIIFKRHWSLDYEGDVVSSDARATGSNQAKSGHVGCREGRA